MKDFIFFWLIENKIIKSIIEFYNKIFIIEIRDFEKNCIFFLVFKNYIILKLYFDLDFYPI